MFVLVMFHLFIRYLFLLSDTFVYLSLSLILSSYFAPLRYVIWLKTDKIITKRNTIRRKKSNKISLRIQFSGRKTIYVKLFTLYIFILSLSMYVWRDAATVASFHFFPFFLYLFYLSFNDDCQTWSLFVLFFHIERQIL